MRRGLIALVLLPVYWGLQVVLFDDTFALSSYFQAHLYLAFFLFLPLGLPLWVQYTLALGWSMLYGLHYPVALGALLIGTTTLLALRSLWVRLVTPSTDFADDGHMAFGTKPLSWCAAYSLPLIVTYEILFQGLSNLSLGWPVWQRVLGTSGYTSLWVFAVFILFYRKS